MVALIEGIEHDTEQIGWAKTV